MTRPVRHRSARARGESGTATAFVVGIAIVLLASAGLVIDGGRALNARMKLADDVEQAARLGANQIDIAAVRSSGAVSVNQGDAAREAGAFLSGLGYSGISVNVNGNTVTVGAEDRVSTDLLQLVGIGKFDISATATAQAVTQ